MKAFLIFSILIFSSVVSAAEWTGKVTNFYVNSAGQVLLKVKDSQGNVPQHCVTGLFPFAFSVKDLAAKEWVSMLLTAKTTQTDILVGYSPQDSQNQCVVAYLAFIGE